jgi:hypothetical protein
VAPAPAQARAARLDRFRVGCRVAVAALGLHLDSLAPVSGLHDGWRRRCDFLDHGCDRVRVDAFLDVAGRPKREYIGGEHGRGAGPAASPFA